MTKEQTEGVMGTLVYLHASGMLPKEHVTLLLGLVAAREGIGDGKSVTDGSTAVMLDIVAAVERAIPRADKNIN